MVRYSDELIEEIKNRNDIIDVISQYVVLKRSGRNFFGLCPFHKEKSGSFCVSPDKQIFHCFGCGVGGNVLHFVSKIENIGFKETIEMLAERSGVELPKLDNAEDNRILQLKSKVYQINELTAQFYHENLYKPTAKRAQEYVKKRKMNRETLEAYRIGFSGKFDELYKALKAQGFGEKEILESGLVNKNANGTYIDRYRERLMFPICDARGKVIAFGGRILDDSKIKDPKFPQPKYINSPENVVYSKGRHLFGLNIAKTECSKRLLIVEGYMDVISLHQRGVKNVVAALGTALTEQQGWLLRKSTEQVILGFDADGAGQTAVARSMEILQKMGCDMRVLQIEGAKDPDEFIVKFGEGRFKLAMDNAISLVEFKVKNLKKDINLENTSDKIKFLNEIAKILAKVDNTMEREIYIEKIASGYNISKEAIYAEIGKLENNYGASRKNLESAKPRLEVKPQIQENNSNDKKEKLIIYLLINYPNESYEKLRAKIGINDIKSETNKAIIKKLYEEFEKGNSNINAIIDNLEQDEQNQITMIMSEDYEITDIEKAIDDVGLGQYIAGMGFSNVGLGIVHSMAHQLGAVYDTPHGLANAILLPTVLEFNGAVCADLYKEILTQGMGINAMKFTDEEAVKTLCEKVRDLSEAVGITQTVKDVGAKKKDFAMLADKAMEDPCKPGNPREVTKQDFIDLYEKAW